MKSIMPKKKKNLMIFTIIATSIIAITIILFIIMSFLSKDENQSNPKIHSNRTEEEIETLKSNFEQSFTNDVQTSENIQFKAKFEEKPIVFTRIAGEKTESSLYDIKVNIPYINIDNEKVEEYNKEIENYIEKLNNILDNAKKNTIYTVEYVANVSNNILSLIMRVNLKEGQSAQRVIIQTYNYDIANEKEITLEEILNQNGISKQEAQNKINEEIKTKQKQVEDLKELGYNIYNRDTASQIYNIEKTTEFYMSDEAIYIIYAYGNEGFTSEMDIIII